ncbi:MAG TPA: hypothetical protein VIK71_00030 [Flavobacteriales bacterium]
MFKRFVLKSFNGLSNPNFLATARKIQEALSQPMFSSIQPTPSDVMPYIDNFAMLLTQTGLGKLRLDS